MRLLRVFTCASLLLLTGLLARVCAASPTLTGDWYGALSAGGSDVPLVFHFQQNPDGSYSGKLDSPRQQAFGLPIASVVLRADSVLVTLTAPAARFRGKLSADEKQLNGLWLQSGRSAALTLQRQATGTAAPALSRAQDPKPPFPYRAEDVTFTNTAAGIKLAGTVTVPPGKGPFPAMVLVTGSGPQDRDETIFGHHPFRVLADYLSRRGILVLRYDDRGVGQSGGSRTNYTFADGLGDAQAALAYLRTRPDVQAQQLGLIGHSEGAMIGLMAATQPNPPAFLISLAGPAVRGIEAMIRQGEDIARAAGASAEQIAAGKAINQQAYMTVLQTPNNQEAQTRLVAQLQQAGLPAAQAQQQAAVMVSDWYRQLLASDPQSLLPKVKVPVLALNGTKDVQVSASLNLPAWEKGVRSGGNQDVTTQALPNLNHLFQTARTGLTDEYGQIEETFSPAALAVIGDWLARHTARKP